MSTDAATAELEDTSATPTDADLANVLASDPTDVSSSAPSDTTTVDTDVTQPVSQPSEDVDDGSFREMMAHRGFSDLAGMASDEEAFDAFTARARQADQQAEAVRWGQYYLQNMQEIERAKLEAQQWRQFQQQQQAHQQAQARQQQAPAAPQRPAWQAPEYDPQWLNLVHEVPNPNKPGETMWVSMPGALPDLPQKIAAYQSWLAGKQRELWSDPNKFIMGLIEPQVQQLVDQRAQAAVQQYAQWQAQQQQQQQAQWAAQQQQQQASKLIGDNLSWMVQCDQSGQPIRNPYTGKFTPTSEGKRFSELVSHGQRLGINNDAALWEYAKQALTAELAQQAIKTNGTPTNGAAAAGAQPPADPHAQTQANKNMAFLQNNRTRAKTPRGTAPAQTTTAPVKKNGPLRFTDMLRQEAAAAGLSEDSAKEDDVLRHLVA